jgi:hypothetical protein
MKTKDGGGGGESAHVSVLKTSNLLKIRHAQNAQNSEFGESVDVRCRWDCRRQPKSSVNDSSLFESGGSEHRAFAQRSVEAVERHRGHQQNSGDTEARIPRGHLGRKRETSQYKVEEI